MRGSFSSFRRLSNLTLGLTILCSFTLGQAFAEQKEAHEHWQTTGLKFSTIEKLIETEACHFNAQEFYGCLDAVNTGLALGDSDALAVRLRSDVEENYPQMPKIVEDFGEVLLIGQAAENPELSLSESMDLFRKLRLSYHTSFEQYFQEGGRVDFAPFVAKIRERTVALDPDKEAYFTGLMLNSYLGASIDPHTYYMPASKMQEMHQSSSSFFGIGVIIGNYEKQVVIKEPLPGGPAEFAGIRAGDFVVSVDGENTTALSLQDLVAKIKGEEGSSVKIGVVRGEENLEFEVIRGSVSVDNVSSRLVESNGEIYGSIQLRSFIESSCEEIAGVIADFEAQQVKGLILDLRSNGGGLLDAAACISGLFIGENQVVVTQKYIDQSDSPRATFSTHAQVTTLPLVVNINSGSASASEIVAGVIQDYERGLVVGNASYGKGTVQVMRGVNSRLLKAETVSTFHLPSGRSNQIVGIIPNIEFWHVPNPKPKDMIVFREEDRYFNAIPAQSDKYVETRPEYVASIEECLEETATAQTIYEAKPAVVDFQLLAAADTLHCMTR